MTSKVHLSSVLKAPTNPITTEWVWYNGNYHRPNTAFKDYGKSPNQIYVYVNGWFDSNGVINPIIGLLTMSHRFFIVGCLVRSRVRS